MAESVPPFLFNLNQEIKHKIMQKYEKFVIDKEKLSYLLVFSATKFKDNNEIQEMKRLFEEQFIMTRKSNSDEEASNAQQKDFEANQQQNDLEPNKKEGEPEVEILSEVEVQNLPEDYKETELSLQIYEDPNKTQDDVNEVEDEAHIEPDSKVNGSTLATPINNAPAQYATNIPDDFFDDPKVIEQITLMELLIYEDRLNKTQNPFEEKIIAKTPPISPNNRTHYPKLDFTPPSFSIGMTQELMTTTKNQENELGDEGNVGNEDSIEEDEDILPFDDNQEVGKHLSKRVPKPSSFLTSPYRQQSEKMFELKNRVLVPRGMIETLQPGLLVHTSVIDAWAAVLNFEEKMTPVKEMRRYFFDTTLEVRFFNVNFDKNIHMKIYIRSIVYDKQTPFIERYKAFETKVNEALKEEKDLMTFDAVDLVFFPVLHLDHYYLMCINLKEPSVDIIDNKMTNAKIQRTCGDGPEHLKQLFCRYLMSVHHKSAIQVQDVEAGRLKLKWRTKENDTDCGVFLMRHMEVYMGDKTTNWDCGLRKENDRSHQLFQLNSMHKYAQEKVVNQSEKFSKKPHKEIQALVAKGWEKRDGRIE
ncbi:hypothetical protein LXL04_036372 [Taraxacum kok-saghyz]